MPDVPVIKGKELIRILEMLGFEIIRVRGSHYRMKHPDGRITTVPLHGNKDLPKGLIRTIIKEDLEISVESFIELIK